MIALLSLFACGEPDSEGIAGPPAVYVNEIVAWNQDGLTDEEDEPEDWIELQVPDTTLDGWTLIPDDDFAEGFALDGIGGGFTVIIADAQPDEGPLHAPFRLPREGGVLLLLDDEGALVQDVRWPMATYPDLSWARVADDDWSFAFEPTPGEVNEFD